MASLKMAKCVCAVYHIADRLLAEVDLEVLAGWEVIARGAAASLCGWLAEMLTSPGWVLLTLANTLRSTSSSR